MLDKVKGWFEGKKTHIVSWVGIGVALAGFLLGPLDVGPIHLPKIEFKDFWHILVTGGGISFLRLGLKK